MYSLRLFNNPSIRRRLHGLVMRLGGDNGLHEDMMQEATIHMWRLEEKRPGQRQAWYLQACRYHLQNYLRAGRSVDSTRHFGARAPDGANGHGLEGPLERFQASEEFIDDMNAKDLISVLSRWLTPVEKQVLDFLADGLSAREIAKRINTSHTRVIHHRRQIALLAVKFGVIPPPKAIRKPRE